MASAIALILLAWLSQIALFDGIGRLLQRALGWNSPAILGFNFWLGWSATILALGLVHFVLPLDGRVLLGVTALALGGHFLARKEWADVLRNLDRSDAIAAALAACVAILLANHAALAPNNPDSAGYHVQVIEWTLAYPVVPGLGNVGPQLGHNQNYFLFAAAMNSGPFKALAYHSTNGSIAVVALAASIRGLVRALGRPAAPAHELLAALLFGPLLLQALLRVGSPSPDLCVFIVGCVLGQWFVAFVVRPTRDEAAAVLYLATTAITVKLALVGLAVPTAALLWWRAGRPRLPVVICGCALLAWLARGGVLSGYPLYPSTFIALPVDWLMPRDEVNAVFDVIRAWGRQPGIGIGGVLSSSSWIRHWFAQAWLTNMEFLVPVGLGCLALVGLAIRRVGTAWTLGPAAIAICFWWLMSPDLRFAGAALWLLAAQAVVLLSLEWSRAAQRSVAAVALVVLGGVVLTFEPWVVTRPDLEPLPAATTAQFVTHSGLTMRIKSADPCWNAPLPCASIGEPRLTLRRAGDLGGGFRIEGEQEINWRQIWSQPRW